MSPNNRLLFLEIAIAAPGRLPQFFEGARRCIGMLDTGSSYSMIVQELVDELQLPRASEDLHSITATGPMTKPMYVFDVGFSASGQPGNSFRVTHSAVNGCKATVYPGGMAPLIIGMDILPVTGLTLLPNGKFYLTV